MLKQQSTVSGAGVLGCREQAACRQIVIRAQQVDQRSSTAKQTSNRRSVLLGAGVAVGGLLLAPTAAQAKLVDLSRQRREQEMMYAPQIKKLDEMMMEQMRAKQAEARGSLGTSARAARRREFQAE